MEALALCCSIFLGALSTHPFTDSDMNEQHELVGINVEFVSVGTFKNSYGNRSYYAGYRYTHEFTDYNIKVGVIAGGVVGYTKEQCLGISSKVCPGLVPSISYTRFDLEPTIMILGEAIAITFEYGF